MPCFSQNWTSFTPGFLQSWTREMEHFSGENNVSIRNTGHNLSTDFSPPGVNVIKLRIFFEFPYYQYFLRISVIFQWNRKNEFSPFCIFHCYKTLYFRFTYIFSVFPYFSQFNVFKFTKIYWSVFYFTQIQRKYPYYGYTDLYNIYASALSL